MQHKKFFTLIFALLALVAVAAAPALGQSNTAGTPNTITVSGTGSATGAPDSASIQLGVEIAQADLREAFSAANTQISQIIEALVAAGVDRKDIQTSNLSIYMDRYGAANYGVESPSGAVYVVSNQVSVLVRDINKVADIVNAAIDAGANNIYGLSFGIAEPAALETEARAKAVENARSRAAELAALVGGELGDAIAVTEVSGGYFPVARGYGMDMAMGGGGAVVEAGQLSVSVDLTVTFELKR